MTYRQNVKSTVHEQSTAARIAILVAALATWAFVFAPVSRMLEATGGAALYVGGIVLIALWLVLLYVIWSVVTSFWPR